MVRRFLPWPLPALLAWAAAWLAFVALQRAHLPAAWALVLACGLGTAASVLGGTWWQRGLIAAGFPLSLALTGAAGLPAWAWLVPLALLLLVYPLLPLPRVIGADIAYAVPLTLVAGLGHASLGSVDWALLAQLLAGSLPGIWIGSRLVNRTPERVIRSALSVLLAWAGFKLILI